MKVAIRQFFIFLIIIASLSCARQSQDELLKQGIDLRNQGNFRGSIVLLKNALDKDPNYYEARYHLAVSYLASGRYESAEKELLKVQHQDPNLFDLRLTLAELYIRTNRPDRAIEEVNRSLRRQPASDRSFDLLGRACSLKREFGKAEEHFQSALRLGKFAQAQRTFSNPKASHPGWGNPLLFSTLPTQGEARKAQELAREMIAADPRSAVGYQLMAAVHESCGSAEQALVQQGRGESAQARSFLKTTLAVSNFYEAGKARSKLEILAAGGAGEHE